MEKLVEFKRRLYNDGIIKRLKNDSLFKDKLLKDIKKGVVYPTIRENRLNFYYYKKLLFEYEDRFITNSKFAFVPKEYHPTYVADGNDDEIEKRYDEILDVYTEYIKNLNKIFDEIIDNPIPTPTSILPKCGLIIFGFDDDQKNGRLQKNIDNKIKEENIRVYSIGQESKIDIKTLYNKMG